jgi:hypothetical protein
MPTPLPTLPGVYYAHVSMTYEGLPSGNIYTFKTEAAAPDPGQDAVQSQTIADSLATQWGLLVMPFLNYTLSGVDAKVYPLGHPTLPAALSNVPHVGGVVQPLLPVSAAAIIRHNVVRRGRGSQSHTAISPLSRGVTEDDGKSITAAFKTDLDNAFGDFIGAVQADYAAAYSGDVLDYVQLSKKGSGATYTITGSHTELLLGTERSRTPRP